MSKQFAMAPRNVKSRQDSEVVSVKVCLVGDIIQTQWAPGRAQIVFKAFQLDLSWMVTTSGLSRSLKAQWYLQYPQYS